MKEITPEDSVVPIYLVPLTSKEKTEMAKQARIYEEELKAKALAEEQKKSAQESAIKKLAALGLTEEEARAIIGI